MTRKPDTALAQDIIEACRWMNASGINQGTSGNISMRCGDDMLLTPSGIPYDQMRPDMLCRFPITNDLDTAPRGNPSSEWRFHQSILYDNPAVMAVVHAHPAHATALAVQGHAIPACHYMIGAFGGADVPLVDYALFGSTALARMATQALRDRSACLLANHGAITTGDSLARALWRMEELENLARVYLLAKASGTPNILTSQQMAEVIEAFGSYGPKT